MKFFAALSAILVLAAAMVWLRHRGKVAELSLGAAPPDQIAQTYAGAPADHADVLIAGDSIAALSPWGEYLGRPVLDEGIPGEESTQLVARIEELRRHTPNVLIVVSGANDVRHQVPAVTTASNIDKLVRARVAPLVIILGVLPMDPRIGSVEAVHEVNRQLSLLSGATYVAPPSNYSLGDTMDGLHPNSKGYRKVTDAIKPLLPSIGR